MTKRATAIIGSSFGDEGKGLMVDYFCRQAQEKPIVVRYNGGAQAGHTVVTPEGKRHVFHHFGAGTLAGAATYLSKYFIVNPYMFLEEKRDLGDWMTVAVHPFAPVTTPWDMFVNQKLEESRTGRHGSCGMGINETMIRQRDPSHSLYVNNLDNTHLEEKVDRCRAAAIERLHHLSLASEDNLNWVNLPYVFDVFLNECRAFMNVVYITDNLPEGEVIFEGAQGLLLDQDNKRFFPHVTHSKTGLHNVIEICKKAGIEHVDACYVARSYLTRHGAGELPGEDPNLSYEDNTNQPNPWQGTLRFAPQDWRLIDDAIHDDYNANYNKGVELSADIAITHVDQCAQITNDFYGVKINVKYESMGPTYKDVYVRKSLSEETLLESHSRWGSELSQSCSSLP